MILLIVHSFTLCQKDFHRKLISVFTFALFTETISTILETLHQIVLTYRQQITNITQLDLSPITNFHYSAQLLHITAINFFILFLLIIAKGWPITRRDMPFKYAFAIFWILCLTADLVTYYWTTITVIAKNFSQIENTNATLISLDNNNNNNNHITNTSNVLTTIETSITEPPSPQLSTAIIPATNLSTAIIGSLSNDQELFNTTPRRLSLLLRIVIMIYFLLELRTTMILEQEKKKLQFYLNFGAFTMVWFVHTLIVYIISLRVDSTWQSKLISGFSSAANFLGFAVTTGLLWPKYSRSYLFRKQKYMASQTHEDGCDIDNYSTANIDEDDDVHHQLEPVGEEYDGLEMRDLSKLRITKAVTSDNGNDGGHV